MNRISTRQKNKRLLRDRKTKRAKECRALRRVRKWDETNERRRTHANILNQTGIFGQLDRDRRPIVLPKIFSYSENFEQTQSIINEIIEHGLNKRTPLEIRFDHIESLEPAAALALAAEIYRCRKLRVFRRGEFVTGNYPPSQNVHAQLSELGFFSLLRISDQLPSEIGALTSQRPIFLRFVTSNRVEPAGADRFVSIIETYVLDLDLVARGRLVGAIKEAMGNVDEHAYKKASIVQTMSKRWYMSARVDLHNHEVLIILYDQGVGIPGTIDPSLLETIRATIALQADATLHVSDGFTIKLATELWRTGTGQQGRGRGFRDMKRFVDMCADGELRVLSNRGRYSYVSGGEESGNHLESLGGTLIQWRFRNDAPLQMTDD